MKKIVALFLILAMLTAIFSSCNSDVTESPEPTEASTESGATGEPTETPTEKPTEDSNETEKPTEPAKPDNEPDPEPEEPVKELKDEIAVETYIGGKEFNIIKQDIGQGSVMNVAKKTDIYEYSDYVADLEAEGFVKYTENEIGKNRFTTLITKKQIVNVMYFDATAEVRVTVDSREKLSLPGLKSENVYQAKSEPDQSFTFLASGHSKYDSALGCIYKLADGTFFIIDGGISIEGNQSDDDPANSMKWMKATLRELADDPDNIVVSTWLLTHVHNDHMGVFMDMSQDEDSRNTIKVERVIYSQPSDEDMERGGIKHRINWIPDAIEAWGVKNVVKAHPGQVFYIKDLVLTIYANLDIVDKEYISNHNNTSIVSTVDFKHTTTLFLADSSEFENIQIAKIYKEDLMSVCDVLQLAHHGYGDGSDGKHTRPKPVYDIVEPKIVLWPNSTYRQHAAGNVYDLDFNQRFFAPGVTIHYAGEQNTTISDFSDWTEARRWSPAGW
ncbi:MAG: hypothetical protein E7642_05775 [Ruminococcaceae bacterium]|nr:hypothetical protein [Oscillospiraceae bacterium]